MNAVGRHSCWSTLKGGSSENALYRTRDSVFLATEMNFVWKSELFLIFDQLFCEACPSMFMPSISDIIHLFPWQNYSKKRKYKIEYFLQKCLFKSFAPLLKSDCLTDLKQFFIISPILQRSLPLRVSPTARGFHFRVVQLTYLFIYFCHFSLSVPSKKPWHNPRP